MKNICVVSDFDGTITEKDTLYHFFASNAAAGWKNVERDWVEGKISSKECLIKEFELVQDLTPVRIEKFLNTIKIDKYFKCFYDLVLKNNIDMYIVSDGVDYFINNVLRNFGMSSIKVITNHGEFIDDKFILNFPNDNPACIKDSGTCKCSVLEYLRKNYEKIIYIGDGVSDFCVADKADILFAKERLLKHCRDKNIKCIPYSDFNDICNSEIFK